jgi:CheY-like chemotaxis protein
LQTTLLILLVEDDEGIRVLLEESLQEGGFELVVAASGAEALGALETRGTSFRGLITDVDLGQGPDGWEVARRARELNPDLSVVYMSGASFESWSSRGVPHSTMVSKPFAPAQILTAISALLNTTDTRG